jgi:DNA-binding NtrC family response regulator
LITDDDPTILNLATFILQRANYLCLKATHAMEALQILSDGPEVHALISDIRMPGMTGIELGHTVREIKKDMPILLMSGYPGADKDDSIGLLLQPKVDFLRKPFTPVQLTQAVDKLLAPPL